MRIHNFKYKKTQKVVSKKNSIEYKRLDLLYGQYGLRSLESFRLTRMHILTVVRSMKKILKKTGVIWVMVNLDKFITSKPAEVRMGKGKGTYKESVVLIHAGTVLFEIGNAKKMNKKLVLAAFKMASTKLPIKTEVIVYQK